MSLMVDIFCLVWGIVGVEVAYTFWILLRDVRGENDGCGSQD
jgi:hypothetical protein